MDCDLEQLAWVSAGGNVVLWLMWLMIVGACLLAFQLIVIISGNMSHFVLILESKSFQFGMVWNCEKTNHFTFFLVNLSSGAKSLEIWQYYIKI